MDAYQVEDQPVPFARVYGDAIWDSEHLTAVQRIVALCYADHARGGDTAWVSTSRLMSRTGIPSRATACATVAALVAAGWLQKVGPHPAHRQRIVYQLTVPKVEIKPARRNHQPYDGPTVLYRWYDRRGVRLYIGISNDLARRNEQHAEQSVWYPYATTQTVTVYQDRTSAEFAELAAIVTERPLFNRDHNESVTDEERDAYLACPDRYFTSVGGAR
jgi:hypothetical protein